MSFVLGNTSKGTRFCPDECTFLSPHSTNLSMTGHPARPKAESNAPASAPAVLFRMPSKKADTAPERNQWKVTKMITVRMRLSHRVTHANTIMKNKIVQICHQYYVLLQSSGINISRQLVDSSGKHRGTVFSRLKSSIILYFFTFLKPKNCCSRIFSAESMSMTVFHVMGSRPVGSWRVLLINSSAFNKTVVVDVFVSPSNVTLTGSGAGNEGACIRSSICGRNPVAMKKK